MTSELALIEISRMQREVDEPLWLRELRGETMRREFSPKIRLAAFERAKGHCEKCTAKLYTGKFHYDHDLPDAFGGEPTLENCRVLCIACHSEKTTKADVPAIAKSNRTRLKHIGGVEKRKWWRKWA